MASGAELRERTKAYASRIIKLYSLLQQTHRFDDAAMVIGKQLLRSGTSVAANHREAKHTRSKADRIAKFNIVLQELEESALWLELLHDHHMANAEGLRQVLDETNQLIGIFITSIKTLHSERDDA
jgi:four helix bundle protein